MMPVRRPWMLALTTAGMMTAPPVLAAQDAQSWLHVRVADPGDAASDFALNVPVSAVAAVLSMIPTGILTDDGQLTVAERHGLSVSGLRRMWGEFQGVDDTEFVSMQHGNEMVRISRAGSLIELRVENEKDEAEDVRVDMPVVVVNALLSGDGETLDVSAALDELSELQGDVMRMTSPQQNIRVWIDDRNTQ